VPVKVYKPTSPGRRSSSVADFSDLDKVAPYKPLLAPLKKTGGRNHQGVTTARFRGGGHKRAYRVIDFKRDKLQVPGRIETIEYDPNRSCRIARVVYRDGERRYMLAAAGLAPGDTVVSGERVEPNVGNAMPLRNIPLGLEIHNIELTPGKGGQICRSAGSGSVLASRDGDYAQLTLPSGEIRRIHVNCRATIGRVGNSDHANIRWGKAGRMRWLGRRPHNRGTSMNPVSHPMGGGEGRSGGGRHPCSPTGKLSKGGRTRARKAISNKFIVRRRKKK